MELFDNMPGMSGVGTGGRGAQGVVASVLELLGNRQGGLSGLAEAFQNNGLGHIVSSWIGTGANLPVSAEQVRQVFGAEQIAALAHKTDTSAEGASSQLADVLPVIVDKLTPGGEVPPGGDLMSAGMRLLQGLMSGR
jgi:uncharacterized protein YidB (DUF937 family)